MSFGRRIVLATCVVLGLSATRAQAVDYFAFGYSGYPGSETLSLTTDSGVVNIGTGGFQGWFSDNAGNTAGPSGNTNYVVGQLGSSRYNNFFVFDLSNVQGAILSATLSFNAYTIADSLAYNLYDVTTPTTSLFDGVSPDVGIFNDLGSGILFGGSSVNPGQSNTIVSFALNSSAVAAIAAAIGNGGLFAIGGSVNEPNPVPLPATLPMLVAGLVGMRLFARRKAARA